MMAIRWILCMLLGTTLCNCLPLVVPSQIPNDRIHMEQRNRTEMTYDFIPYNSSQQGESNNVSQRAQVLPSLQSHQDNLIDTQREMVTANNGIGLKGHQNKSLQRTETVLNGTIKSTQGYGNVTNRSGKLGSLLANYSATDRQPGPAVHLMITNATGSLLANRTVIPAWKDQILINETVKIGQPGFLHTNQSVTDGLGHFQTNRTYIKEHGHAGYIQAKETNFKANRTVTNAQQQSMQNNKTVINQHQELVPFQAKENRIFGYPQVNDTVQALAPLRVPSFQVYPDHQDREMQLAVQESDTKANNLASSKYSTVNQSTNNPVLPPTTVFENSTSAAPEITESEKPLLTNAVSNINLTGTSLKTNVTTLSLPLTTGIPNVQQNTQTTLRLDGSMTTTKEGVSKTDPQEKRKVIKLPSGEMVVAIKPNSETGQDPYKTARLRKMYALGSADIHDLLQKLLLAKGIKLTEKTDEFALSLYKDMLLRRRPLQDIPKPSQMPNFQVHGLGDDRR